MMEEEQRIENLTEAYESQGTEIRDDFINNFNCLRCVDVSDESDVGDNCNVLDNLNSFFGECVHLSEDSNLEINGGLSDLCLVELPDVSSSEFGISNTDIRQEKTDIFSKSRKHCQMEGSISFKLSNRNYSLSDDEDGKLCICDNTDDNRLICPNCLLLQQHTTSGNKRKSQENFYGLHEQISRSKQLMEESSSWLLDSTYVNFKKTKIPLHTNEPLLQTVVGNSTDEKLSIIHSSIDVDKELEFYQLNNINADFSNIQLVHLEDQKIINELQMINLCSFDSLPTELKLKIFSYFTQRDLCRYIAPVCSTWFELSKDSSLWQRLSSTDYEDVPSELFVRVIISWCKHVTDLELTRRIDITVTEFREIFQNCPNIQYISVAFCSQIDNEILGLMGRYCKCVTRINMEGCNNITDQSFYNFVGLPLTSVSVSHCNMVSDDGGIFLARNFKYLVEINFDGIQWMSEEFIRVLVSNQYKTLEKAFLDGENLGDDVVRQLSRCKQLRTMSFSFCTSMTHHAIEWVGQCVKLEHLQLRKGTSFTNASLLSYFQNMGNNQGSNFKYLNLAECSEISDRCLFSLSEKCPNLKILDLSWCWEVSDDGLAHIIDNCQKLNELHLKGLHEMYGTPFFYLPSNIPKLTFLDLSQCNKIQDELIEFVVQKMKDLVVYNYYGDIVVNTRHREAHRYINK